MKNSFLRLHFIVFIWGFTAILGGLISLKAIPLVWNRMFLAVLTLFIFLSLKGKLEKVSAKMFLRYMGAGIIIAAHWITFFWAIKISTVSVTLACISSGAFFAAMLEPLFYKQKIVPYEIILGLLTIAGIATIFAVETEYKTGIIIALTSALLSAMFTIINGKLAKNHDARTITVYELFGGWLGITIFLLLSGDFNFDLVPKLQSDWIYLVILGTICTAYPFLESVRVMKDLNPFTVMLTINLEPIYGILMAYFILNESEKMTAGFYIGASIILTTVFANAWFKYKAIRVNQLQE